MTTTTQKLMVTEGAKAIWKNGLLLAVVAATEDAHAIAEVISYMRYKNSVYGLHGIRLGTYAEYLEEK